MTGLRKSDKKIKKQKKKYILNAKRFKVVIDELKERISTKSEKLMRYRTRDNQYRYKINFSGVTKKHCIEI